MKLRRIYGQRTTGLFTYILYTSSICKGIKVRGGENNPPLDEKVMSAAYQPFGARQPATPLPHHGFYPYYIFKKKLQAIHLMLYKR